MPKLAFDRFKIFSIFTILMLITIFSCKNEKATETVSVTTNDNGALMELSALISKNPEDVSLLFERANLYYENEAFDEALDDIVSAQKIDSLNPDLYHLQADVYMDYYRSFDALKTMEKVVRLHPQRIASLLKLAEFKYILKMYNESILTLNDILAIDQLEPEAYFMLGMNFRALGDMEMAKNSFLTATENKPELIDAWIMLGQIHENEGDEKAIIFYDNALLINPESIEALHAKAFYYQNNEEIAKALEIYKRINLIDPQYPDAYLNSGLLFLEIDSLAKANEQFNIMIQVDLTNPIAYFYRAYTYEQAGNPDLAKSDYEQALKLAPDFREAREALELLMTSK